VQRSSVDSVLRSTQAYCQQLCDKQTLDFGIAFYSKRFAGLAEANQFREVIVEDAGKIPEAYEQAERWFSEQGLSCFRWAPAGGRPTPELEAYLLNRGFTRQCDTVMALVRWGELGRNEAIRVLPARAMRAAFAKTIRSGRPSSPEDAALMAEAYGQRLDDPQFDMFVATCDHDPAGHCALYQVGDMARVMDLSALPSFAGRGVDRALLGHVLTMARRLAMKNVYVQVPATDAEARALYESAGFIADGEIIEFERDRPAGS